MTLRVCHLTSVHPSDDIRIVRKELRSLAAAGYDVHLVAPDDGRPRFPEITYHPVRPAVDRSDRFGRVRKDVIAAARAVGAGVYHCHDLEMVPAALALQASGARVVYDVHEDVPKAVLDKPWIPRPLRWPVAAAVWLTEARVMRRVDAVVAATPAIARRFPLPKTTTVQNFPFLDELGGGASAPMRDRPRAVTYVGGLQPIRGIVEMVDAMARLDDAPVRLVLGGQFGSTRVQQEVARRPGWRFVEHRGQMPRAAVSAMLGQVRAGLVLFHPAANHIEAQPNKLFEYMSAGLPVIASHFPLWRRLIEEGGCGRCVDPLDPGAIGDAIRWICDHPDEAEAMGKRGRAAVEARYNWEAESGGLLALYERLTRRGA